MARNVQKAAQNQLGTTNKAAGQSGANAENIYSSLEPQLESMATNPQGFGQNTVNQMQTGARQSLGGSTAGITGQANLNTARTRNSGGYNATLDEAAQTAGQTGSEADLAIQAANAQLKQQQQQSALASLGNLEGQQLGSESSLYGLGPSTLNAWTNAGNSGWLQNTTNMLNSLGNLGKGVAGAGAGVGA